MGQNMPKVKFPLLDGKGKYLQFAMAYQEKTKDFTNELGQFEGDLNKLLQLVKDAMCDKEDKKNIRNHVQSRKCFDLPGHSL